MYHLRRRFLPISLLFLSINGMIGSAWLFAPLYAAKIAGSAAIISWILGGLATVLIALTFAEISTLLPIAGGTTRFSQLSHGDLTSFIISWITWLSCVTTPPIEVQATLQYASTYFPSLIHPVQGMPELTAVGLFYAFLLMLLLTIINMASFRGIIGFNLILFTFKVLVIVLTISLFMKTHFNPANFIDMKASFGISGWEAILTAVASGGIAFAFTGFKHSVELAGESRNPHITIPVAIIGSVLICLILYVGLQVAFIGSLDSSMLAKGWHMLSYTDDIGPYVGIAAILGLAFLVKLLYIDSVVSPLGAGFVYMTSTSRIIFAMSKNGYLPQLFSRLNKHSMPFNAIALNFVVGMFLFLPLPGWQNMVSFLVSAVVISYAMGPIALLCLRRQLPNERRSFRLPFANTLCFLSFYCCNLISYWTGWDTLWKLAIAVLIGFIILIIAIARKGIEQVELGMKAMFWLIPYLLGLMLISYLGSFGGKHLIPFGWDFLIIAIFSAVILWLAVTTRITKIAEKFQAYKTGELVAE